MVNKPRKALSEIATSDDEMDDFIDDTATQDDPSFENDDRDLGDEASYDVIDPAEIASETEEPEGDPRPPAAPKRAQVKATPVVSQRKNPAKVAKKGAKSKMKTTSDVEMEDEDVASQRKSPAKVAKKGTKSKYVLVGRKEATPEMETEDEEYIDASRTLYRLTPGFPGQTRPFAISSKGKDQESRKSQSKAPADVAAQDYVVVSSTEILEISDTDEGMPVSVPLPPKSPAKKAAAKKATPKKNNLPVPSRSTRAMAKKKQNTAEKTSINSTPIQSKDDEEPKAPKRPRHDARPETLSTTPLPRKSPLKRSSEKMLGSVIESIYEEPKKDEDEEIGSSVDMKGKSKASPAKKYKSAEEVQSDDGDESPTTIGFVSARTQLNLSDKKVVALGKNSTAAGKKTAPGAPALGLEKKSQVLTFAQQLKIAPVDANIRIPAPELGLFKAPDVCAVNNPAIHDPVLKVDYEGILARLPTFRGWGSSDVGDNFGFFFSHWGVYAPHVPYGAPGNLDGDSNTLFPVKFEKYGRFVNLARVHPGYVHCKVAQGNLGMYTADGLAICLTPGSVVESALVVQAENRRKSIDIQLYTQEYQRFQAVICARLYPGSIELHAQVKGDAVQFNTRLGASSLSNLFLYHIVDSSRSGLTASGSSPKKMTQLVTRLSLDGSGTIPVFDARDTVLDIQHLTNLPKGLPLWTAELPARSCVIVGHTVGVYDGVNINLNLHFVVLIGLPAGYEPE
ncbi:hypothetical protein C8R44DRAFT_747308 [Mycena epipterygia]|nr:hypothetical protein C8R44DRAFT_747308 [Mycena epipterygia]